MIWRWLRSRSRSYWRKVTFDEVRHHGEPRCSWLRRRINLWEWLLIIAHWMKWRSRTSTHYRWSMICLTSYKELRYFPRSICDQDTTSWRFENRIYLRQLSPLGTGCMSIRLCHSDWLTPLPISWVWWTRCSWSSWINFLWCSLMTFLVLEEWRGA